jgi:tagaturonate reductase
LTGVQTVGQAMGIDAARRFLAAVLAQEVIPFLGLPAAETATYAEDVLRRFANPFIHHQWHDISLNAVSKIRVRLLDRIAAHEAALGTAPPLLSLSLAAWVLFYLGRFPGAPALPPRDTDDIRAAFAAHQGLTDPAALARAVLSDSRLWGRSIDSPALRNAVASGIASLTRDLATGTGLAAILQARE